MTEVAERTGQARRTKQCNSCGEYLLLENFAKFDGKSIGRLTTCNKCRAAKAAERQERQEARAAAERERRARQREADQPAVPAGPVTYRDVAGFAICDLCQHWQRSGARHTCPCPCHAE